MLRRLLTRWTTVLGLVILMVLIMAATFAVVSAPAPYDKQDLSARLKPPMWMEGGTGNHPLGTDELGRDLLSRLMYGARVSLLIAAVSVGFAVVTGTTLGLWSSYVGGIADGIIMRLADAQLSFPYLLLAVAIMATGERGLLKLIVVLALGSWVPYARTVRAGVLSIKEMEFIDAARAIGTPTVRVLLVHILPNVAASIIVISSFQFAQMILAESSLGFLGLGVQPPTPSWGGMLSRGRSYFTSAWWLATLPGLAIVLATLSANFLGDGLRDALDPRLRLD